jgi:hypothetical protein
MKYRPIECKSGFGVSIQASSTSYCTPRNVAGPYTHVELGYPSHAESLIKHLAEDPADLTGTVYGWVPVGLVKAVIIKHGGIESGTHPAFNMDTEQSTILAEALLKTRI